MGRTVLGLALSRRAGRRDGVRADDDAPSGDPFYRLDTKNLFGALEGADVGDAGDRSIELETTRVAVQAGRPLCFHGAGGDLRNDGDAAARRRVRRAWARPVDPRRSPTSSNYAGVDFSGLCNEWRYVLAPRAGAWSVQTTFTVDAAMDAGLRGRRARAGFCAAAAAHRRCAAHRPPPLCRAQPFLRARSPASSTVRPGRGCLR